MSNKRPIINIVTILLVLLFLLMDLSVSVYSFELNLTAPDILFLDTFYEAFNTLAILLSGLAYVFFRGISLIVLVLIIILQVFNYLYYRQEKRKGTPVHSSQGEQHFEWKNQLMNHFDE